MGRQWSGARRPIGGGNVAGLGGGHRVGPCADRTAVDDPGERLWALAELEAGELGPAVVDVEHLVAAATRHETGGPIFLRAAGMEACKLRDFVMFIHLWCERGATGGHCTTGLWSHEQT